MFTNSNSAFATAGIIAERRRLAAAAIADIDARGLAAVEDLPVHPRRARRLPPALHEEMVADARRLAPRAIADSYRHLNVDVSVREEARSISVPTLMVCGRYEKRFAPHRDYTEAHLPGLRIVDLPGGHAVNAECAGEFNEAVAGFLRETAVGGPRATERGGPGAPAAANARPAGAGPLTPSSRMTMAADDERDAREFQAGGALPEEEVRGEEGEDELHLSPPPVRTRRSQASSR